MIYSGISCYSKQIIKFKKNNVNIECLHIIYLKPLIFSLYIRLSQTTVLKKL